ncbi:MAG: hypothetical protein A2315_05705 [Ignavibacteria bacterium RIFOXYB2_FULL_35_12]|nr:MAG: hypothetical protein A2058_11640 [Ignavibacteria bacterium GWA2_36_19]OGU59355.1 MAG: hypothetical protein A2X60_11025 [Ignavibacteria bacterium GWF2_35_20]OGU78942.1 MAG: hypothetical protein A2254_01710 [Ignavibacteria bacterium RIFOXYA2_FULL_35_9]OGU86452.1 MAG: hypothetical protein A3K31_07235 [Ignavibacteria bacterium RIFOXYA12_FULL_35_25]OGU92331.1 MAG: hypothetical protein A2492_12960 [Ignavibacteria bacterium RIFOXYC12_FULL_35_11]OGU97701.1 MAG: hypothetical protein A2347_17185
MRIDRKKFFLSAATGFLGITLLRKFPFNVFRKNSRSESGKIQVKINPSAVSRSRKEGGHA